ncbi:Gfo/Idh/MocA family oxidoreductase [Flavitalea sp. BT771]|uniref:Gfo/Idh/MocA family protein n=1 Tax=Flavitalea sp. BT771 TaxID=3063329 RepID=UPI0026E16983|nr:Gfo/Idh/MocA family oxidoreductase [Flavitalea sp. BT771]MDO6434661.1 Gfo/Idh/MocA family oxidoreductase [Flavitalea sp. BT771]MDV6223561.1 Gfo/Idh/MocA family oxidoreductase [Flavitalea sp. BT771]
MDQKPGSPYRTRREFVKASSLLAGSILTAPLISQANFFSGAPGAIRVALIGCGGRGTGAAVQALSTKQNVQLVAMADAFKDRLDTSYNNILEALEDKKSRVQVKEENKFTGFDAYKKAMALADVVILATPPGFRPIHFEEAVNQGKQVFMEKPVATDPAGVQRVLAAAEKAKAKKLNVVVGLQRRYQASYRELIKRVHDGAIGEITSAQAWWNNDGVWVHPRQDGWTEMEYQMRNWYYFVWLCGDHITEQHIHNLDVINWAMEAYPVRAQGMGGREVRKGKDYGQIYDHHFVEFQYGNGVILNSQCRHQKGTMSKVDELLIGTKGRVYCDAARIVDNKGNVIYQFDKKTENQPYQNEHDELFEAIAKGEYKFWDAERGARSTMTSILGRMATYSGQNVEWDKAINSGINIMPAAYAFDATPPVLPDASGLYPVPEPGQTKFF